MAFLRLENGKTYTQPQEIARELAPLQVQLNYQAVENVAQIRHLLDQASLKDEEKEQVLQALDSYFEQLKQQSGYQARDLIVLHPNTPNLQALLAKFERPHTHADDEVRYIIEGEGVFGFVRPDGSQIELTIQPAEYINVPARTEHWFHLTETNRIKAVRYFTTTQGWTPQYTQTVISINNH